MPAPAAPLAPTIQPAAPTVRGVTLAAREARAADERPASPATLAIMPTVGDLRVELGLGKAKPAAAATADSETRGQGEGEEETEAEEEASAEESTAADTSTEAPEETTEEQEQDQEHEQEVEVTADLPPEALAIRTSMQKRIDKLTAVRTDHEGRIAELEGQLESARAGSNRPEPTAADPLAHINSARELDAALKEARAVKDWALRHRNGGELTGAEGAATTYDADEVGHILANAERELDAAPARREWLGRIEQSRGFAAQAFPEFYTKGSQEAKILAECMAGIPASVKAWRPDIETVIVQALVGASVMNGKLQQQKPGAAAPKPLAKAPPSPGGRTAPRAPAREIQQRHSAELAKKIPQQGNRALEAAVAARLG